MLAEVGEDARDLGEFGLIERLLARLGGPGRDGVLVGPGDDAAAVRPAGTALATADLLLEGRHFDFAFSSAGDVGWKALAVNVSDIAAMGGVPRYALVSLGAPASTPVATLEALYDGLAECARPSGFRSSAGTRSARTALIVSVAVLGDAGPAGRGQRAGARAGRRCLRDRDRRRSGGRACGCFAAPGRNARLRVCSSSFPGLAPRTAVRRRASGRGKQPRRRERPR